jgi:hypothetical protein
VRGAFLGCRRAFGYPGLQQCIDNRKHNRTDEKANDAEGNQSADNAGKDQQKRQLNPLSDQEWSDKIIYGAGNERKGQQNGPTSSSVKVGRQFVHSDQPTAEAGTP